MIVLALDTTTRAGSVALMSGNTLLGWLSGDPERTHGERLPAEVLRLLAAHETSLRDVEVFAVCAGPGSFTGLRIGLATVQGFALATGRPVMTVPTLEALAYAGLECQPPGVSRPAWVVPWMDAHRGEVFGAVYRVGQDGVVTECYPPVVGSSAALLEEWVPLLEESEVLFVGNAVERSRVGINDSLGAEIRLDSSMPPLAPTVAALAQAKANDNDNDNVLLPHAIRPVYVRRPDAELARDRRR